MVDALEVMVGAVVWHSYGEGQCCIGHPQRGVERGWWHCALRPCGPVTATAVLAHCGARGAGEGLG